MIICNIFPSNFEGLEYDLLIITIGKTICLAVRWGEWQDPNGCNLSLTTHMTQLKFHWSSMVFVTPKLIATLHV